ncbi:MAG TPA: S41 family peptidase [Candidatus Aquilonibacter sp.]|nr:S41 family peptidase [Candidatus Aquilonibacter sp.]
MTRSALRLARIYACAVLLSLGAAAPAFAQTTLPAAVAADVNESYRLLAHTYYKPVEAQSLVDAARAALVDAAGKHRVKITVDPIAASQGVDATLATLDQAIAEVAQEAHGTPTEYAYAAINGMAKSIGDRYTVFMDPQEFRAFNDALDPERISGIGVMVGQDASTKFITVSYVVPGTPADRAGLLAGDEITSVDGTSTKGITTEAASKLLRGKAGTAVHLQYSRATETGRDLTIVRSEIQPPTVVAKMLPDGIGYIYVIAFGKDTPEQFDGALARLHAQNARALVIDLRNDGGGYVDSALDMTSRFVAKRPLLTVEQRGVPDQTIQSSASSVLNVPVTVLVNKYTASASEIMAGALQDDGIASLVGTRTFGKGVMQTLTPLADGSAIKITTAHYLTPRKRDINLKGIDPDVSVDEPNNSRFGDVNDDAQLKAALQVLQKKIATVAEKP